ncbi:MAG: NifB/NifX family molybdenum-iron cluster-binding protein [Thermoplasmatota archaeon]
MIIGIPTMGTKGMDEMVGEHFGRTPTYTLYDTETGNIRVIENTSEHMGGTGQPPELLARNGVGILVCQGLGRRAIALFRDYDICVFIGASGTVSDAIGMWKDRGLVEATEDTACGKHMFRSQHHGDPGHGHHRHH